MKPLKFLGILLFLGCGEPDSRDQNFSDSEDSTVLKSDTSINTLTEELTFLALGDSYTIGESVAEKDRWPVQLATRANAELSLKIDTPQIIARTGWTTDELQTAINSAELDPPYDLVSLLIGVNNQYRGYDIEQYKSEFETLLKQALTFAGDSGKVFVVSIPDYGVTPFASGRDAEKIGREIDEYNRIAKQFADTYEVTYFDITPISRKATNSPNLIASDGLHPSDEMYEQWVELILPWIDNFLEE